MHFDLQPLSSDFYLKRIGKLIDDAMDEIEKDNATLKGVLPKNYARQALDKKRHTEIARKWAISYDSLTNHGIMTGLGLKRGRKPFYWRIIDKFDYKKITAENVIEACKQLDRLEHKLDNNSPIHPRSSRQCIIRLINHFNYVILLLSATH